MSKKNLAVSFVLLSGMIAVLAYAAGSRSNRLTDEQINFEDKLSSKHENLLTAPLRDSLMNDITTRATNHEKRLQVFAQSSGYPNLTSEQTTFTDLLSTRNDNQLTSGMWNNFVTNVTTVATNHEMRLRGLETVQTKVDGKCGIDEGKCITGKFVRGNLASIWHCEGSDGGQTEYNCQSAQYVCVGQYDTGRKNIRWYGVKEPSGACYLRKDNRWGAHHSSYCKGDGVNGIMGTRGFFDETNGNNFTMCRESEDGEVHKCTYGCSRNPEQFPTLCTKVETAIMESCVNFDQNRCAQTVGCARQKK